MKKSIKKLPVTKTTKAKAPAKATATPAKKAATPASKATAPAKKKSAVSAEPPATFISAQIDIGFGNHLYIRGEGPGLSWDHGIAMDCTGSGLWTSTVKYAAAPVLFKVLVNDLTWSKGPDFIAKPGKSITVNPTF